MPEEIVISFTAGGVTYSWTAVATASPPAGFGAFLLEDGTSYLLLESGDRLLLE